MGRAQLSGRIGVLVTVLVLAPSGACSPGGSPERQALQRCQSLARDEMTNLSGNPRYRKAQSEITRDEDGPDGVVFSVRGEYYYKDIYSRDNELRFNCTVARDAGDTHWRTVIFDSSCSGGCS